MTLREELLEALFDCIDSAPSATRRDLLEALTKYRRTYFRTRPVPLQRQLEDTIAAACGDVEGEYRKVS